MYFETADKAARRLGCTVRAVQKWAKEGKIPGAYKDGRDWKIPTHSVAPGDSDVAYEFHPNEPFPIIHTFQPGLATDYVNSIEREDDRSAALCEMCYFTGDFGRALSLAKPYLDSENPILRLNASVFFFFANLSQGNLPTAEKVLSDLNSSFESTLAAPYPNEIKAASIFASQIVNMQLHLETQHLPPISDNIKYLDGGLRLMACYISAYNAYFDEDYSRSLGIVETALSISMECYPIPMIYLHIIEAMDYINLHDTDKAMLSIEKAWTLAAPDGFITPFAEHYSLLQGLIEKFFKRNHPEDFSKIITVSKEYNRSWYKVYNKRTRHQVARNLTHTEFTIAMLYSRNWRAKEIAAHLELSERTITNYITVIYDKLGVNGKKELKNFVFR